MPERLSAQVPFECLSAQLPKCLERLSSQFPFESPSAQAPFDCPWSAGFSLSDFLVNMTRNGFANSFIVLKTFSE